MGQGSSIFSFFTSKSISTSSSSSSSSLDKGKKPKRRKRKQRRKGKKRVSDSGAAAVQCASEAWGTWWLVRMPHKTKQQPMWYPDPALLGCCFSMPHFLLGILASRPVHLGEVHSVNTNAWQRRLVWRHARITTGNFQIGEFIQTHKAGH